MNIKDLDSIFLEIMEKELSADMLAQDRQSCIAWAFRKAAWVTQQTAARESNYIERESTLGGRS